MLGVILGLVGALVVGYYRSPEVWWVTADELR